MTMPVRFIEWVDSLGNSSWEPLDEVRLSRPMHIFSVGFVVAEGDNFVTLLQSYDERTVGRPHGDHYTSIPKIAIVESKELST